MAKSYIIDIGNFEFEHGGIVAMHKLCHDLRTLGHEAYITGNITHPILDAPKVNRTFNRNDVIIVYPEITIGNPLGATHVVRWLLNTPGKCAGIGEKRFYDNVTPNDIYFKYSEYFDIRPGLNYKGLLTTLFIDHSNFRNLNQTRNQTCYLIKKGGMNEKMHPDSSIDLGLYQRDPIMASKILNSCKYFYCYDNACFWVVMAALCGCIAIVIPDGNSTAEEWYEKFPHKTAGVAYGFENLKRAEETLCNIKEKLIEYEAKHIATIKNFVNICESL
jgi:hypothetical protein